MICESNVVLEKNGWKWKELMFNIKENGPIEQNDKEENIKLLEDK